MKEAKYYETSNNNKVICRLCPHNCIIAENKSGICRVRSNISGKLFSDNYGKLCSISLDPIEKKPLYHFFPGKNILSIGSVGCNLTCKFCQNSNISQKSVEEFGEMYKSDAQSIVKEALKSENNIGIAYTYNEPTVWFEYMKDIAFAAKKENLKNVMVSNGYINIEPLNELLDLIDGFNIDLKSYSNEFYKDLTQSKLQPVLNTIKKIIQKGKHIELTYLIIPENNDDEEAFNKMMIELNKEYGKQIILHLSKYFPRYKFSVPPTPEEKMFSLYKIAKQYFNNVYLGNIESEATNDSKCLKCGKTVVKRNRYNTKITGLNKNKCSFCGENLNFVV